MKRLCIKYLNSDTIIIATAGCLWGLNGNNSPWFQRSCGEPAPVNNQLVRDKTGLACLGKKSWSKGWAMPWLEEGWMSSARSQKKTHGAAGCCGFEHFGEEGGIWTGRPWKKSAAGRQAGYLLSMKGKGKKYRTNVFHLETERSNSFYCCFCCSASTIFFLDPVDR